MSSLHACALWTDEEDKLTSAVMVLARDRWDKECVPPFFRSSLSAFSQRRRLSKTLMEVLTIVLLVVDGRDHEIFEIVSALEAAEGPFLPTLPSAQEPVADAFSLSTDQARARTSTRSSTLLLLLLSRRLTEPSERRASPSSSSPPLQPLQPGRHLTSYHVHLTLPARTR